MASLINRSITLVSNGFSSFKGLENSGAIMNFDADSAAGGDNPLRIFVSAKKDINAIFVKLEKFVKNVNEFYHSYDDAYDIHKGQLIQIENTIGKISGIREVLSRNHMKVAFFGRTSNGKSTVINSILQNKILPSGIGHTTNCFLQVEGTDELEPYLIAGDSQQRRNIDSVKNLANALSTESLGDSTLVKIYWPKSKCSILHDDVVLVDSPGTDVTEDLDKWIDLHCLDADVFVLVSNAESTLMQTEKNFFIKVREKLSKPNVFILNNRWDASAAEPESQELVRKQHLTRDIDFLVNDLNVVDDEENAKNFVFFVSAREVLRARTENQNGTQINLANYENGFESRFLEFVDFEKKFEQCLSKSAVHTKFSQHTHEVVNMTADIQQFLEDISIKNLKLKNDKIFEIKQLKDRVEHIRQQFQLLTNEVKHQICNLVKQVEMKVSSALNEEIRRLSVLVNDFEKPFSVDTIALGLYKKELHAHVEKGLGSNLRSRLSTALSCNVESTQTQMIEGVQRFIPEIEMEKLKSYSISPEQNFKVNYRLNCESLCSDFVEDLEFKFSYGFVQLLQFLSGRKAAPEKNLSLSNHPSNTSGTTGETTIVKFAADKLLVIDKLANSRTSITMLAVGGCLVRLIGWHVIAITGAIYVLLYAYERISWTSRAKEDSFKKQYVAHATKKLRLIIDLTSANCSHQVQQ